MISRFGRTNKLPTVVLYSAIGIAAYFGFNWFSKNSQPFYFHTPVRMTDSTSSVVPKIVLFGDSITEASFNEEGGWGAIIADRLRRKCDVLVRGFSGYNTRMARAFIPAILATFGQPVVAVTVMLGTNDDGSTTSMPIIQVPLDEYKENLIWMIQYMQAHGISKDKIILMPPPLYDGQNWAKVMGHPSPVDDNVTVPYLEACREVAVHVGCDFVDLHQSMRNNYKGNWRDLLTDGVHLSVLGGQVVADSLWPFIAKRTRNLTKLLPGWKQVLEINN